MNIHTYPVGLYSSALNNVLEVAEWKRFGESLGPVGPSKLYLSL